MDGTSVQQFCLPYAIQLPDLSKEVTEENEEKCYLSNRIIKKKKKKNSPESG